MRIILLSLSIALAKNITFIRERGVAFENLTDWDVVFVTTTNKHTFDMSVKIPLLHQSFSFKRNCFSNDSDLASQIDTSLNVTALNGRLTEIIRQKFSHILNKGTPKQNNIRNSRQVNRVQSQQAVYQAPAYQMFDLSTYPPKELSKQIFESKLTVIEHSEYGFNKHWSTKTNALFDQEIDWANYVKAACSSQITVIANTESQTAKIAIVFRHEPDETTIDLSQLRINATGFVSEENDTSQKQKIACGSPTLHGTHGYFPIIFITCDTIEETVGNDWEYIFSINSENACNKSEWIRISEVLFLTTAKSRKRRQFGLLAAAGMGLISGFGSMGLSAYYHHEDTTATKEIKKEVNIMGLNEHNFEDLASNVTHNIAIANHKTELLIEKSHKEFCQFVQKQEKIDMDEFLATLASNFANEIDQMLLSATIPLPNNDIKFAATQVCRSKNRYQSSKKHCAVYYDDKNTYRIDSIYIDLDGNSKPEILIRLVLEVPTLNKYEGVTAHALAHVPTPLYKDKKDTYHFWRYNDIPRKFAVFSQHGERKIPLSTCSEKKKIFFCELNILNDLYANQVTCLNTIFSNNPKCTYTVIQSISNCVYSAEDSFVLISHIGEITVQKSSQKPNNIVLLDNQNQQSEYGTTNISFISSAHEIRIKCKRTSFYYSSPFDPPTAIHMNASEATVSHYWAKDIQSLESLETTDEEISQYIQSMKHVTDQNIIDAFKLQQKTNEDAIDKALSANLNTSTEAAHLLLKIATIASIAVVSISLVILFFYCIKINCSKLRINNRVTPLFPILKRKKEDEIELESYPME